MLDPAQLAIVYAATDQQSMQQYTEARQLQLQASQVLQQQQQQQQQQGRQNGAQAGAGLQSHTEEAPAQHVLLQQQGEQGCEQADQHATSGGQVQDWPQLSQQVQEEEEEDVEELICMDDPRFAALSERKKKLMALEEILLNTGIEG